MTAPRIDTTRNAGHRAIHRLAAALDELTDLHTLGWYRHADHRAKQRVTGGDPTAIGIDLDNHGDPRYRTAYEQLANAILHVEETTAAITDARATAATLFGPGKTTTRRETGADATSPEVIEAMARQINRYLTGQDGSTNVEHQPMPANHRKLLDVDRLNKELDNLRNAVRKMRVRPDRGRLTPTEVAAWQTALGTTPKGKRKANTPS